MKKLIVLALAAVSLFGQSVTTRVVINGVAGNTLSGPSTILNDRITIMGVSMYAGLLPAVNFNNAFWLVLDCTSTTACTAGGGTAFDLLSSNGTSWNFYATLNGSSASFTTPYLATAGPAPGSVPASVALYPFQATGYATWCSEDSVPNFACFVQDLAYNAATPFVTSANKGVLINSALGSSALADYPTIFHVVTGFANLPAAASVPLASGSLTSVYLFPDGLNSSCTAGGGTTACIVGSNGTTYSVLWYAPQGGSGSGTVNSGTAHQTTVYSATGNAVSGAGPGTTGQVLTSNGAGSDPTYQTASTGSGTVNSGTAHQTTVYSAAGTAVSGAGPGTTGQILTSNGSGSDPTYQAAPVPSFATVTAGTVANQATFPGGTMIAGGLNKRTCAGYTMLATDVNKIIVCTDTVTGTLTIPVATTTGFTSGAQLAIFNQGSVLINLTPTTSTANGSATLPMYPSMGYLGASDGTNYSGPVTGSSYLGYSTDTGSANSPIVTFPNAPLYTGLVAGMTFDFKAQASSTSSGGITINGTSRTIHFNSGGMTSGDLIGGLDYRCEDDGTNINCSSQSDNFVFRDNFISIANSASNTKKASFSATNVTAGQTRSIIVLDATQAPVGGWTAVTNASTTPVIPVTTSTYVLTLAAGTTVASSTISNGLYPGQPLNLVVCQPSVAQTWVDPTNLKRGGTTVTGTASTCTYQSFWWSGVTNWNSTAAGVSY